MMSDERTTEFRREADSDVVRRVVGGSFRQNADENMLQQWHFPCAVVTEHVLVGSDFVELLS